MREIIHIQIGKAGNAIGTKFWETIIEEHGITRVPLRRDDLNLSIYFNEANSRQIPRSIGIGMDSKSGDLIRHSGYGVLYQPDNLVFDDNSSQGNFAKAYLTEGAALVNRALEVIRIEAESCDNIQGFQILHSISGGCGSGITSLLLEKLRYEYNDRLIQTYTLFPSVSHSSGPMEPYNAVLALTRLIEYPNNVVCFDNQALNELSQKRFFGGGFDSLNQLIANVMSGVTASLRFPGSLNTDLRKLHTNLVPYPNIHFLLPAHLTARDRSMSVNRTMLTCEFRKYLTLALLFRGKIQLKAIYNHVQRLQKMSSAFIEWMPDHLFVDRCECPPCGEQMTATMLGNNTGFSGVLNGNLIRFHGMLKKKAHLHWYTGEGMDEADFTAAAENVKDLQLEYEGLEKHSEDEEDVEDMDEKDDLVTGEE